MAKRKRQSTTAAAAEATPEKSEVPVNSNKPIAVPTTKLPLLPAVGNLSLSDSPVGGINFQVITGSYEKTLHGFVVTIPETAAAETTETDTNSISLPATFADSFLFTAHTAPIETLSISPVGTGSGSGKRILATSSADEHIHLYTLSSILSRTTSSTKRILKPSSTATASNPKNKHLGTLTHHLNTPTALVFTPTRSKLISAGLDGQIHILRCRDWALMSTLKCPKPKAKPINYAKNYTDGYGPRIETFSSEGVYGGGAGGVNDVALHPSQKILLSVGKGERGVRMWNLMTGRKAGVLMFGRDDVPHKFGRESTKVEWSSDGNEYAVAFERGVVVFGADSKPKCRISATPVSKIHKIHYMSLPLTLTRPGVSTEEDEEEVLAVSTEDGRILFYSTTLPKPASEDETPDIDSPTLLGVLGGKSIGMVGRVKDFATVKVSRKLFVITASSSGVVRVWELDTTEDREIKKVRVDEKEVTDRQVGKLVGIYETERRITCLGAMEMEVGEEVDEPEEAVEENSDSDTDDDDDEEE
ncbi:WD40 repeat-like protein [Morchella conica CCBAS932]|uniref:WD40 repeat-like protein n=1 Tax=Morchella conica CCBAS932 TaxID=1392247 RepID=A0A3N4KP87_9PEZI|nr:WD40 repeat-like protein [Morchella conica CCBAS932]